MDIQDLQKKFNKVPPWSVGTKKDPRLFSNTEVKQTPEFVRNMIKRTNHVRNNGSLIQTGMKNYNIQYDWKNGAHELLASIDYVRNVLNEEPVVDYGDKDYQFFLKLADSTEYPEGAKF